MLPSFFAKLKRCHGLVQSPEILWKDWQNVDNKIHLLGCLLCFCFNVWIYFLIIFLWSSWMHRYSLSNFFHLCVMLSSTNIETMQCIGLDEDDVTRSDQRPGPGTPRHWVRCLCSYEVGSGSRCSVPRQKRTGQPAINHFLSCFISVTFLNLLKG